MYEKMLLSFNRRGEVGVLLQSENKSLPGISNELAFTQGVMCT